MTYEKDDDICNEEDSTFDQTDVEIGISEHCLKNEMNLKKSSMLGVVSSASTHHISTERSSSVEINNAAYPLSKLPSMDIEECSVGPVSDILSNRDRDESLLLDIVSSTSETAII